MGIYRIVLCIIKVMQWAEIGLARMLSLVTFPVKSGWMSLSV